MNWLKITACFLAASTLIVISCNKDSTNDPCSDNSLIRKVSTGELDNQQITYNSHCQVAEYLEAIYFKRYSYNGSNQLTKVETAIAADPLSCFLPTGISGEGTADPRKAKPAVYSQFEYDASGKIYKKSDGYYADGVAKLNAYKMYEYQNGHISAIQVYTASNVLTQRYVFTYNGENLIHKDHYVTNADGTERLYSTYDYTLDDHFNPYILFAIEGEPGKYTNVNNILSETVKYYSNGVLSSTYTYDYAYEYNTAGYPSKMNNMSYIYGN